jgi:hypothetical protein
VLEHKQREPIDRQLTDLNLIEFYQLGHFCQCANTAVSTTLSR